MFIFQFLFYYYNLMNLIINDNNIKIIPIEPLNYKNNNKKLIFTNDEYSKYEKEVNILCHIIESKNITQEKKIINETYDMYLNFIKNYDIKNDKWIYNIIDGFAEQTDIIYKNNSCIIIPTITWDKSIHNLHILGFPTNKKYRSLRDLTSDDIVLLQNIKENGLKIIKEKYNLIEDNLKIYIHYPPSTYHLHIHFVNVKYTNACSSVEYSHLLDNVIFNLILDSNYYKKIIMKK